MMLHGSGGRASSELIGSIFAKEFDNEILSAMEDAAVVNGSSRIAVTTDSFVVTPLEFPGGDLGRLCVCGTVNDLLMRGAVPRYITCGFILETGADVEQLKRIAASMAKCAKEAGVTVVAGDTKVIEGSGGIYVNTTGVGFVDEGVDIAAGNAIPGDVIIVSGTMGDHHAAILSQRMTIKNDIESDNAPLLEMVNALKEIRCSDGSLGVHTLRDVTRGGLATVLSELAAACGCDFMIEEEKIPVSEKVRDFAGLLGLDPLYMGNEGKLAAVVAREAAPAALDAVRRSRYGRDAAIIGQVQDSGKGTLALRTALGGIRRLLPLEGEGLPRIC